MQKVDQLNWKEQEIPNFQVGSSSLPSTTIIIYKGRAFPLVGVTVRHLHLMVADAVTMITEESHYFSGGSMSTSIRVRFLQDVLNTKLPHGVMVAQENLDLFAQVRVLVGQQMMDATHYQHLRRLDTCRKNGFFNGSCKCLQRNQDKYQFEKLK